MTLSKIQYSANVYTSANFGRYIAVRGGNAKIAICVGLLNTENALCTTRQEAAVLIADCHLSQILIRMMTMMVRWVVAADLLKVYRSAGISDVPEYRQNAHAAVGVLLMTEGTVSRST